MNKFLCLTFVFASIVTLAACSSTVTGTAAMLESDAARVDAVDSNVAETSASDNVPPDAAMYDADHDAVTDASDAAHSGDAALDASVDASIVDAPVDAGHPSSLVVSIVPIPIEPLTGRHQRTMRLHYASSGPRPVALKRLGFTAEMSSIRSDAMPVAVGVWSNDMPLPDILIHTSRPVPQALRVSVFFYPERVVNQVGFDTDFIVGLNRDAVPGDRLRVVAQIQPGPSFGASRRGALTPRIIPVWGEDLYGPHVYDGELPCRDFRAPSHPDVGNVSLGFFVWSPMTDPRHSDADCTGGGSTDWVNGATFPSGMFSPTYETELTR